MNNESDFGKEQFGGQKPEPQVQDSPPAKPFLAGSPLDQASLIERVRSADKRARTPIKLVPDVSGVDRIKRVSDENTEEEGL